LPLVEYLAQWISFVFEKKIVFSASLGGVSQFEIKMVISGYMGSDTKTLFVTSILDFNEPQKLPALCDSWHSQEEKAGGQHGIPSW